LITAVLFVISSLSFLHPFTYTSHIHICLYVQVAFLTSADADDVSISCYSPKIGTQKKSAHISEVKIRKFWKIIHILQSWKLQHSNTITAIIILKLWAMIMRAFLKHWK